MISTDGIIKNLRVKLSGSPGAGNKYTFTLMLNGAPTALTFDIANAATSGSNMVNEIDVTGGDTVSIQCDPDSTPTVRTATWTCMFEGDTANESLIIERPPEVSLDKTGIEYAPVMGYIGPWIVEDSYRQVCPTAGTIKNLYVKLSTDPGTPPDAYRFTVRKGGISQTLTVTIVANNTTGNDVANSFAVVAGDILTMMIEPLNTPSATPWITAWGMTFVSTIDGESIQLGGTFTDLDDTATEYSAIAGSSPWTAVEATYYRLGQVCTIKKLYVLLSAAPGAGNSYTFSFDVVGDSNTVAVTVADAATTGNSGALTDTVANDDYVLLKVVPDDTPDVVDAYWGFVCYIDPAAPPAGAGMGAKPPIMELLLAGVID